MNSEQALHSGNNRLPFSGPQKWTMAAATVVAILVLLSAVLLGRRAGHQHVQIQSRQQIGILLQYATDLRYESRNDEAIKTYERVLLLDPNNSDAIQGIAEVQQILNGQAPDSKALVTTTLADEQWLAAEKALAEDDWDKAIESLEQLRTITPDYNTEQTISLLAKAYIDLATQKEEDGQFEEALLLLDRAIDIKPAAIEARSLRNTIAKYQDALTIAGTDWARVVGILKELERISPGYRDVRARLQIAHMEYGDSLVKKKEWCKAVQQYNLAIAIEITPGSTSKRNTYRTQCEQTDLQLAKKSESSEADLATQTTISGTQSISETTNPKQSTIEKSNSEKSNGEKSNSEKDDNEVVSTTITGITTTGTMTVSSTAASITAVSIAATAAIGASNTTITPTPTLTPVPTLTSAPTLTPARPIAQSLSPTATTVQPAGNIFASGRILYSAQEGRNTRSRIFAHQLGRERPLLLVEDASQPALHPNGLRLAHRSLRSDAGGIVTIDNGTNLILDFTQFVEDALPSWSPEGNRIVFASNREGDRRWRIYTVWAEENGAATFYTFGEAPAWHPVHDQIAYRGCDQTGNRCGLWTMNGNGGEATPLTDVPEDNRPTWTRNGRYMLFMSNARHGNMELYRLDLSNQSLLRLTDNPAIDGLPTVSPDGTSVAFLTNRSGNWEIWAVSINGGDARKLISIIGTLGENWLNHGIQWVP